MFIFRGDGMDFMPIFMKQLFDVDKALRFYSLIVS